MNSSDSLRCFFDSEGTVLDNDKFYFVRNGVFVAPSSDKKLAQEFGYDLSASASSAYDTVPVLGWSNLDVETTHNYLEDILKGQQAIVVIMASGGDFTTEGGFGTPVQLSFLYKDGRIIGRLPEIQLNSNIYKMFGEDFRGSVKNRLTPFSNENIIVMDMDVRK
jgi:PmbA protein